MDGHGLDTSCGFSFFSLRLTCLTFLVYFRHKLKEDIA